MHLTPPLQLLAAVAAGLDTPHDLWHAAIASKRLLAAVRDAGVRIALTPQQQYALNNPSNAAKLDAMVACIAKYYPGVCGSCGCCSVCCCVFVLCSGKNLL